MMIEREMDEKEIKMVFFEDGVERKRSFFNIS